VCEVSVVIVDKGFMESRVEKSLRTLDGRMIQDFSVDSDGPRGRL
jgi:hypothetical protein